LEELTGWEWFGLGAIIVAIIGAMIAGTIISEKRGGDVKGIGGWLWLPIISFIFASGFNVYHLAIMYSGESLKNLIDIFSVENNQPAALMRVPYLGSTAFSIAIIFTAGLCLYLIYKKSSKITMAATFFFALALVSNAFEYWADGVISSVPPVTERDPTILNSLYRSILPTIIWTTYFHVSKRVKNTFVN
jgi:hypothetical protein